MYPERSRGITWVQPKNKKEDLPLSLTGWTGSMLVIDTEARPGLSDDDRIAGVAGVKADLDRKIDADVANVFGERANVLGALIGNAGDAIAVDEGVGCGIFGFVSPARLRDAAINDAAGCGKVVAALALDLFLIGLLSIHAVPRDAGGGNNA